MIGMATARMGLVFDQTKFMFLGSLSGLMNVKMSTVQVYLRYCLEFLSS